MKTPHTPGPWATFKTTAQLNRGSDRLDVASTLGTYAPVHIAAEMLPADAQLISAAPELLDALKSLAVWNGNTPCFCHVHGESERARYTQHDSYCDKARAAIGKAEGRML